MTGSSEGKGKPSLIKIDPTMSFEMCDVTQIYYKILHTDKEQANYVTQQDSTFIGDAGRSRDEALLTAQEMELFQERYDDERKK